jgi:recombination protein RecR
MLPRIVRELTQDLNRLPGIGPKTAQRMALHLLNQPRQVVVRLADTLKDLHANVRICHTCYNLAEDTTCAVCQSQTRMKSTVCVVEDALDVEALEKAGAYDGLYHVLGGVLSPMEAVGPEQLRLKELFLRLESGAITELIIALDHTMESEATARYISHRVDDSNLRITRLARGLPTGGDIEFADAPTLRAAISGRKLI